MSHPAMPKMRLTLAMISVAGGLVSSFALAQQNQNPIQAFKNVYNQSKQQQQKSAPQAVVAQNQTSAQAQGAAAPWTPPSDTPNAPAGSLDASRTPDIVGIHLGMTLREAAAALQSAYPKLKITPIATAMPAIAKPVAYGLSTYPGGADGEVVNVSVVLPPSQQRVWAVYRKAGNMAGPRAVNRGTLLASLRQKYGKESYAITSGEPPLPKNDSEISQIYWLFDEQGKRISPPTSPFPGCEFVAGGSNGYDRPWNAPGINGNDTPLATGWCASAYVAVHATLSSRQNPSYDPEFIEGFYIDAVELPFAVRAQKATLAWYLHSAEKQHQQEIEKSKKAPPKL